MNPINCWNCGKLFADLKFGIVQTCASTTIKDISLDCTTLEIYCPRCKKYNSILFTKSKITDEEYLPLRERKQNYLSNIQEDKLVKLSVHEVSGDEKLTFKIIDRWMRTNRYDNTLFK